MNPESRRHAAPKRNERTVSDGRRVRQLCIPSPVGELEAVLFCRVDENPRTVAVFCHPHPQYGGTMHNRVAYRASEALFRCGMPVLRFNFRGVGKSAGEWTGGPGEVVDAGSAITFLLVLYPACALLLAGFSFGAGIALRVAAADERVAAMIGIAPSPTRNDFSPLVHSRKPKGIIQGTADDVCPAADLESAYRTWAEPRSLRLIPGAGHFFEDSIAELQKAVTETVSEPAMRRALAMQEEGR